jgi:hypothetical protein
LPTTGNAAAWSVNLSLQRDSTASYTSSAVWRSARSAISALEDVEAPLLLCVAGLRARQLDELVGHEAFAHGQRRAAVAVAQPEDERLQRPAALGTRQRRDDAKAVAGDRARDHLEGVARSRPSEGGLHDDLPTLARAVGIEQRQGAFEDLEGVGRSAGRARAVVLHDVFEREADARSPVGDLDGAQPCSSSSTVRSAVGWTSRRPSGIGSPLTTESP